ncbi:hypothetical protein ACQUFY_26940 (plasmid) [Robbsia andropogonis]|uniref:hypothetical protein n=1 Tax=Robbsia andropogonis TaxID=28092 RepID=UPI003D21E21D
MRLYLCEKRREADVVAAVLGIRTLGAHAYSDKGRYLAWFHGEPSVTVGFHGAQPISPQLLGVKALLDQVDDVVIVDTGSSSRRDARIVLDLLGYRGQVSVFENTASEAVANDEVSVSLPQVSKEITALMAREAPSPAGSRKRTLDVLNNALRTLFQAGWKLSALSELNAIHLHVLLSHWEHLCLPQREIAERLDQLIWLAKACSLRHVATLGCCVQRIMCDESVPGDACYSTVWLLCARQFDATWLSREPAVLARDVMATLLVMEQEKDGGR